MFRKRQNKASASALFQKMRKDCSAKFMFQIKVAEELDIIYLLHLFKIFRVRKIVSFKMNTPIPKYPKA